MFIFYLFLLIYTPQIAGKQTLSTNSRNYSTFSLRFSTNKKAADCLHGFLLFISFFRFGLMTLRLNFRFLLPRRLSCLWVLPGLTALRLMCLAACFS